MLPTINLPLILAAGIIATGSPGPATLAIAGTSMNAGRRYGLAMASGMSIASLIWSISAAFGLAAVMLANGWAFEIMRYIGAGYLIWLAYKSAKSALKPGVAVVSPVGTTSPKRAFAKGFAIHITNPKAILFFGSLYAIAVPPGTPVEGLLLVICAVGIQSAIIFHGYALLFSNPAMMRGYMRLRCWFEGVFAVAFGLAGFKILTAKLG